MKLTYLLATLTVSMLTSVGFAAPTDNDTQRATTDDILGRYHAQFDILYDGYGQGNFISTHITLNEDGRTLHLDKFWDFWRTADGYFDEEQQALVVPKQKMKRDQVDMVDTVDYYLAPLPEERDSVYHPCMDSAMVLPYNAADSTFRYDALWGVIMYRRDAEPTPENYLGIFETDAPLILERCNAYQTEWTHSPDFDTTYFVTASLRATLEGSQLHLKYFNGYDQEVTFEIDREARTATAIHQVVYDAVFPAYNNYRMTLYMVDSLYCNDTIVGTITGPENNILELPTWYESDDIHDVSYYYYLCWDTHIYLPFNLLDGSVTGISHVTSSPTSASQTEYFDLQGRRVDRPGRGLYLRRDNKGVRKVLR